MVCAVAIVIVQTNICLPECLAASYLFTSHSLSLQSYGALTTVDTGDMTLIPQPPAKLVGTIFLSTVVSSPFGFYSLLRVQRVEPSWFPPLELKGVEE